MPRSGLCIVVGAVTGSVAAPDPAGRLSAHRAAHTRPIDGGVFVAEPRKKKARPPGQRGAGGFSDGLFFALVVVGKAIGG